MRYGIGKDHRLSGPLDLARGHGRNRVPVIERPRDACIGWYCDREPISAIVTADVAVPVRSGRRISRIRRRPHTPDGTTPEGVIKKGIGIEYAIAGLVWLGDIGRQQLKPKGLGVIDGVIAKEREAIAKVTFIHDRRSPPILHVAGAANAVGLGLGFGR